MIKNLYIVFKRQGKLCIRVATNRCEVNKQERLFSNQSVVWLKPGLHESQL